jgi:hypothetical protein
MAITCALEILYFHVGNVAIIDITANNVMSCTESKGVTLLGL